MGKNFNTESFDKGKAFENYIQNVIFTVDTYDQLARTPDIDQNAVRFTESTLDPDFYYKCRKTQKTFYVEAKFRSQFFTGNILNLFNQNQFDRFKEIDKPKTPIFVAIGCGGTASEPSTISIVPFSEITNLVINKLEVDRHLINKGKFNHEKLWELIISNGKTEPIKQEKQTEQTSDVKQTEKKRSRKIIWLILTTFFVLVLAFSIPQIKTLFSGTTPENIEVIKPKNLKSPEEKKPIPLRDKEITKNKPKTDIDPADLQSTVDMLNNSLVGDWTGKFDKFNLLLHIDNIDIDLVINGYDIVGENKREVKGKVEYEGNSNFSITMAEPADDNNDGLFKITYTENGSTLKGTWTANIGKLTESFTLKQ